MKAGTVAGSFLRMEASCQDVMKGSKEQAGAFAVLAHFRAGVQLLFVKWPFQALMPHDVIWFLLTSNAARNRIPAPAPPFLVPFHSISFGISPSSYVAPHVAMPRLRIISACASPLISHLLMAFVLGHVRPRHLVWACRYPLCHISAPPLPWHPSSSHVMTASCFMSGRVKSHHVWSAHLSYHGS